MGIIRKGVIDGETSTYKLLQWNTKEETEKYILENKDRLELVK